MEETGGKGTFFVSGCNLFNNRELVREVSNRGHLIGNHTYMHPYPFFRSKKVLYDEIVRTKDLIEETTGKPNRFFRPPYGIITPKLLSICRKLDLSMILWNVNSKDFNLEAEDIIIKRVSRKLKSGAILLFHDCHFMDDSRDYSNTFKAMLKIVGLAVENKLKPVTIEKMFETV